MKFIWDNDEDEMQMTFSIFMGISITKFAN